MLTIEIQPSRYLQAIWGVLYGMSLGVVAYLGWVHSWLWWALALPVSLDACYQFQNFISLTGKRAVRQFSYTEATQQWQVWLSGRSYATQLLPDSYISAWLIVLRFTVVSSSSVRVCILLPDSAHVVLLQRLRIILLQLDSTTVQEQPQKEPAIL